MTEPARRRLHVITWGCQMNVYDSGRMTDVLAPLGYAPAETPEGADSAAASGSHARGRQGGASCACASARNT
jgi:tRNA-2-methylthio-N6-dimethylallyladenosine synthase